jgi:hypothetical protein
VVIDNNFTVVVDTPLPDEISKSLLDEDEIEAWTVSDDKNVLRIQTKLDIYGLCRVIAPLLEVSTIQMIKQETIYEANWSFG